AVQISDVPACEFARCTRVHSNPAPETVEDCCSNSGPSDATKATITSPERNVPNAGVVSVPLLSLKTIRSTAGTAGVAPASAMTISTAAKFHWSCVGETSLSCTCVPAPAIEREAACTQNVSLTSVLTASCSIV